MARKRRVRNSGGELIKIMMAAGFLAALWLSVESGLMLKATSALMEIARPKGETNAGVLYREEVERQKAD